MSVLNLASCFICCSLQSRDSDSHERELMRQHAESPALAPSDRYFTGIDHTVAIKGIPEPWKTLVSILDQELRRHELLAVVSVLRPAPLRNHQPTSSSARALKRLQTNSVYCSPRP